MQNTIADTIASFLKQYEPFNFIELDDLKVIVLNSNIITLQKGKSLFKINDPLHESFYIAYAGVVHLTKILDAEEVLHSKCYSGNLFGLRPFFAKNNYVLNATANEDAILLAIPIIVFKPYLTKYSSVLDYFLENFATQAKSKKENYQQFKSISEIDTSASDTNYSYFQDLQYTTNPTIIDANTSIKNVVLKMIADKSGHALITYNNRLVGLVTDADLAKKIGAGLFQIEDGITKILNPHFIVVDKSISVAEAQLLLLKNDTSHLCVTEDGTQNAAILGVVSERDVINSQSNNPGILIKEIKSAHTFDELKYIHTKYLDIIQNSFTKNIPIFHINAVASELLFSIIQQNIQMAIAHLGTPPARFVWLAVGSQGRKEQLYLSDQDSLLIYEDVAADKQRDVKYYFVQMAKMVIGNLEKLGYKLCPNDHMASSVKWCRSLTEFAHVYQDWMVSPNKKDNEFSSIFFDFEYVFGEIKIKDALESHIYQKIKSNTLFFDFLGNKALKLPEGLTFFKKIAIEENGTQKDHFDLKQKGLQVYIDAARLFALSYSLKGVNNTYLRYKQLAISDPKNAEKYLDFAENYLQLQHFRIEESIVNDTDGSFIKMTTLSKVDKEKLKKCLMQVDEVIELIKDKYQLTQFS
jgi:CBS domain-containing protein